MNGRVHRSNLTRHLKAWLLIGLTATAGAQTKSSVCFGMPQSRNPFSAYSPSQVPEPQLANSPLLNQLIRGGKLYLSLKDAIQLALQNNLDLAIARYNLPIADTDILRTQAGGIFMDHRPRRVLVLCAWASLTGAPARGGVVLLGTDCRNTPCAKHRHTPCLIAHPRLQQISDAETQVAV